MSSNPKVSVIVPIYKVRDFIARCAESLMEQTLADVEYIFVDDCTPDDSISVLESVLVKYPERKEMVRILRHEQNKGLPSARNTGLRSACGEYVFHCDSDDYVEKDMLEKMVCAAEEDEADFVWCDWYLTFERKERYMKEPEADRPEAALKNVLSGIMKYNVWNKLVKRSIYQEHNVWFPDGYGMGEDMTMIRLLAHAHSVRYVNEAFYHYVRTNTEAFTHRISDKHLEALMFNTQSTIDYLRSLVGNEYNLEIAFFQQNVKLPFLISSEKKDYMIWQRMYPESNPYILENKQMSLRTRVLQWSAYKKQYWYVRLYNMMITMYYKRFFHE